MRTVTGTMNMGIVAYYFKLAFNSSLNFKALDKLTSKGKCGIRGCASIYFFISFTRSLSELAFIFKTKNECIDNINK
jgi:hypothetical protein